MSGRRSESKELLKRFFEYLTKIETELVKGNQDKIFKIRENGCFTVNQVELLEFYSLGKHTVCTVLADAGLRH